MCRVVTEGDGTGQMGYFLDGVPFLMFATAITPQLIELTVLLEDNVLIPQGFVSCKLTSVTPELRRNIHFTHSNGTTCYLFSFARYLS